MKILLIRLRLIGDVVFTTPLIGALRRQLPDAQLFYLVEAAAAPVVRGNPHLDEVLVVDKPRGWQRVSYDLRLARHLRQQQFDVVIDCHGGPRSALWTWLSGAPQRIGYNVPGRRWAYTHRLPWTRALTPPRHSVENQADLLKPLGVTVARSDSASMPVHSAARAAVDARLQDVGVTADRPLIVMHVSAGNPFRRWPADHFVTVAATLAREDETRRIIISSGPSERDAADRMAAAAQAAAGPAGAGIVRAGEFDLGELRALLERAALYIGGDSGPLHIASTSDVPIVAIFGPTLPARSLPWRGDGQRAIAIDAGPLPCRPCHQRVCGPGDFRCLTRVDPARVIAAARDLLASSHARTVSLP